MLCLGAAQGGKASTGKERGPARVITLSSIFPFSSFDDDEGAEAWRDTLPTPIPD